MDEISFGPEKKEESKEERGCAKNGRGTLGLY